MIAHPMWFKLTSTPFALISLLILLVQSSSLQGQTTLPAEPPPKDAPAKATPTLMYRIPSDIKVADTICSTDCRHVAAIETKDGKYWVVVDGVRSPPHEWVVGRSLTFCTDGGRFAYVIQRDGSMFLVVGTAGPKWNAVELPGYYMVGRVILSSDGKRYAFAAQKVKEGKLMVVVDGVDQPQFDEIFASDMQFSDDGKRFAYRASAAKEQFYVVDGVSQPSSQTVGGFLFSSNASHFGYLAVTSTDAAMVIDGKVGKRYAIAGGLIFSPDNKKYAYAVEPAGPDGKRGGKQQLIYNGGQGEQSFAPFEKIGVIGFSPDSRRLALTGLTANRWNVIVDGKVGPGYDATGGLQFSPDSKHLAVVVSRGGKQFIAVDAKELPSVDVVGPAAFSPDSNKLAYIAKVGAQRVLMVDDKQIGPAAFFAFTPDSKHIGHALPVNGGDHWTLALDGAPIPTQFDGFPFGSRLIWESNTVARVIAGRDAEMFSVKVELTQ